jgi:hypothetical protein
MEAIPKGILEGAAWYGALWNAWGVVKKTEGAAVAGHHRFVTSSLLLFLFSWVYFCCCSGIFLVSNCCVGVVSV